LNKTTNIGAVKILHPYKEGVEFEVSVADELG
jgi:hypothetical protein